MTGEGHRPSSSRRPDGSRASSGLTPLIYGRHGNDYLIVASKGGTPENPAWYHNLSANPEVEIQVKGDKMRARARTATPAEKAEMWPIMTKEWPDYDDYQTKTDRDIPIVVVEPLARASHPG